MKSHSPRSLRKKEEKKRVWGVAGYKQATSNLVEHKFIGSARANLAGILLATLSLRWSLFEIWRGRFGVEASKGGF
jgi:hypothetical protein